MASELFPFKFFDSIRGRWIQARYKATPADIAARYEKWEITGPGRTPNQVGGSFVPFPAMSEDQDRSRERDKRELI
jgi:hypothetical protein